MTEQELRHLLTLFYRGDSTTAQEQQLADFFASGAPVPPDLEAERAMFAAMADIAIPDGFDERFAEAVDSAAKPRRRRLLAWISGAAACALLAATGFEAYNAFDGTEPAPMAVNAGEVAEQTEMALRKFNDTFTRGLTDLDRATQKTSEATLLAFSKL